jgi:hypothetical protein
MASSDTEHLLRLKPVDSINVMVTNANQLVYPVYDLKAGLPAPVGADDRETLVHLTARDRAGADDGYPYTGEFDFTYRRLHLEDYLKGELLGFRPTLPCSTQTLLDEITSRTGLEFYLDDVVHEEIGRDNSHPYVLKAKTESLRWVGQVEFYLADVQDLSTLFGSIQDLAIPPYQRRVAEPPTSLPYVILPQPYSPLLDAIVPNVVAQTDSKMEQLFRYTVPAFDLGLDPAQLRWTASATPGAFNLYNAVLVNAAVTTLTHPVGINPALTRAAHIRLDLTYCTNVTDPNVYVWYAPLTAINRQLSTQPRLTQSGTLVTLDATAYQAWIQTLTTTMVIESSPYGSMLLDGPNSAPWVVSGTLGPTNLRGAVVQYNGPRRAQDNLHINPNLTHVLTLTMNELYNSLWRGNLSIYYRLA